MDEKLDYFIDQTNERLQGIEKKLEMLIGFRFLLLGGSAVISALIGLAVALIVGK